MKKLAILIIAIICCLAIVPFIKCKQEPVIVEKDPVQYTIDSLKSVNDSLRLEIIFLESDIKDLDHDYFAKRDSILN